MRRFPPGADLLTPGEAIAWADPLPAGGRARTWDVRHIPAHHDDDVRSTFDRLARRARVPRLERATITVLPFHPAETAVTGPGLCAPAAAEAIAGITDAGVLPPQGGALLCVSYLAPIPADNTGLVLRIREVVLR